MAEFITEELFCQCSDFLIEELAQSAAHADDTKRRLRNVLAKLKAVQRSRNRTSAPSGGCAPAGSAPPPSSANAAQNDSKRKATEHVQGESKKHKSAPAEEPITPITQAHDDTPVNGSQLAKGATPSETDPKKAKKDKKKTEKADKANKEVKKPRDMNSSQFYISYAFQCVPDNLKEWLNQNVPPRQKMKVFQAYRRHVGQEAFDKFIAEYRDLLLSYNDSDRTKGNNAELMKIVKEHDRKKKKPNTLFNNLKDFVITNHTEFDFELKKPETTASPAATKAATPVAKEAAKQTAKASAKAAGKKSAPPAPATAVDEDADSSDESSDSEDDGEGVKGPEAKAGKPGPLDDDDDDDDDEDDDESEDSDEESE